MSEPQLKNDLFEKLSNIENQQIKLHSNTRATAEGIYDSLCKIFRDDAHIIDPKVSSAYTPADEFSNESCRNYINALADVLGEGRELLLPVIAIWNTALFIPKQEIDYKNIADSHWETLVILPKYFTPLNNQALNNNSEIVFFKDSNGGHQLSEQFISLLTDPQEITLDLMSIAHGSEEAGTRYIGGIFDDLIIYNTQYKDIQQQENGSDCGWWAVYNACMFVFTGNPLFLNATSKGNYTGLKIRHAFCELGLYLAPEDRFYENKIISGISITNPNLKSQESASIHETSKLRLKIPISIPLPTSNFVQLALSSDLFVDKTEFIKTIIDYDSNVFITRPRKWGKSINADMLRTFFQPDVTPEGTFDLSSSNKHYNLFAGGLYKVSEGIEKQVSKLQIAMQDNGNYLKQEGQYPVILITMPSYSIDLFNKENGSDQAFRDSISQAYKEHEYIVNSLRKKLLIEDMPATRRRITKSIRIFEDYQYGNISAHLDFSIHNLMKVVFEHYNTQVIVIIDEADAPLNALYGYTEAFGSIVTTMITMYVHPFKNKNPYLKSVIFLGILPLAMQSIFSSLNLLRFGVLDEKFANNFGFTKEEVDALLDRVLDSKDIENQKDQIKSWYNGYKIGEVTLYNPWSIVNCLSQIKNKINSPLQAYWLDSENPEILENTFNKLSSHRFLSSVIKADGLKFDFLDYKHIYFKSENQDPDIFIGLLLHSGYLTCRDPNTLIVPNHEARLYFYHNLLPAWLDRQLGCIKSDKLLTNLSKTLDKIGRYTKEVQIGLLNAFDQANPTEANFNLMLGGCAVVSSKNIENRRHIVSAEITNKYNFRLGNIFFPINKKSDIVVINEYKSTEGEENASSLLEDAIWQVYVNQYMDHPLSKWNQPEFSFFKFILVRAIVFYKDSDSDKWKIKAQEFLHDKIQANTLKNIFLKYPGPNTQHLIGRLERRDNSDSRDRFLEHIQCSNIMQLLNALSVSQWASVDKVFKIGSPNKYSKISLETGDSDRKIIYICKD